jgi:hypothetical protein
VPDSARCDDADACNGLERCNVERGCEPGAPLVCDDGDDCTTDACEAALGCVSEPRDRDGDGFGDGLCGGRDCVDDPARGGATVGPGRPEICDNALDDDCDGLIDYQSERCVPTNDRCATARVLAGSGTYYGATRSLAADYGIDCNSRVFGPFVSAADAVFRFTLTEPADVLVWARMRSLFGIQGAVSLRRWEDCATGPELAPAVCEPGERVRVRSLPAGDYAILVGTSAETSFPLVFEVGPPTVAPPIDVCGAGALEVGGGGSFRGFRSDLRDDYGASCGTPDAPGVDAAYRLTLDAPKDVRIVLRGAGALTLTRDCADSDATLACVPNTGVPDPVIERRALPAGTYFVIAEPRPTGTGLGDGDAFALDVEISEPSASPRGDVCETAVPLVPGVRTSVPLDALRYDVGLPCAFGGVPPLHDAVFRFTTTEPHDVTLSLLLPPSPGFGETVSVALTGRCGDLGATRACARIDGAFSPVERVWRALPAGTWEVLVGTSFRTGSIDASLSLGPPSMLPANDTCGSPQALTNGVSTTFVPSLYEDDEMPSCSFAPGRDAYFSFTLAERQQVDIIGTTPEGAYVALALYDTCGGSSPLACVFGSPAAISQPLDAGTYILVADVDASASMVRVTPFFTPL